MSYTTKQVTMPWEVYTNTIDEIKKGTDKKIKISFTGGEPFVNPKFVDMLKYAKENGVYRCSQLLTDHLQLRYMKRHCLTYIMWLLVITLSLLTLKR